MPQKEINLVSFGMEPCSFHYVGFVGVLRLVLENSRLPEKKEKSSGRGCTIRKQEILIPS